MQREDPVLRTDEASEYTGYSRAVLAQLRFKGIGPAFLKPTPRTVRYRQSDLDTWLESSARTSTAQGAA